MIMATLRNEYGDGTDPGSILRRMSNLKVDPADTQTLVSLLHSVKRHTQHVSKKADNTDATRVRRLSKSQVSEKHRVWSNKMALIRPSTTTPSVKKKSPHTSGRSSYVNCRPEFRLYFRPDTKTKWPADQIRFCSVPRTPIQASDHNENLKRCPGSAMTQSYLTTKSINICELSDRMSACHLFWNASSCDTEPLLTWMFSPDSNLEPSLTTELCFKMMQVQPVDIVSIEYSLTCVTQTESDELFCMLCKKATSYEESSVVRFIADNWSTYSDYTASHLLSHQETIPCHISQRGSFHVRHTLYHQTT